MSTARNDTEPPAGPPRYVLIVKRVFDVVASASALVLLSPLLGLVALAIRLESPGPAIFRQQRVGKAGKHFRICKFRSMVADASTKGTALTVKADPRITRVGAFIRRHKIDELPQLFNVLSGSMSIVGPRPEVPQYMRMYTPAQQAVILSMQPGITDYAAIAFRNESELLDGADDPVEFYRTRIMPAKYAHYARYKRDMSLLTDLKLIFATLGLLFWSSGKSGSEFSAPDTTQDCPR